MFICIHSFVAALNLQQLAVYSDISNMLLGALISFFAIFINSFHFTKMNKFHWREAKICNW